MRYNTTVTVMFINNSLTSNQLTNKIHLWTCNSNPSFSKELIDHLLYYIIYSHDNICMKNYNTCDNLFSWSDYERANKSILNVFCLFSLWRLELIILIRLDIFQRICVYCLGMGIVALLPAEENIFTIKSESWAYKSMSEFRQYEIKGEFEKLLNDSFAY